MMLNPDEDERDKLQQNLAQLFFFFLIESDDDQPSEKKTKKTPAVNNLEVRSVFSPHPALLSVAPGPQSEAGSFGERRDDTEQKRFFHCTWSAGQRTDTSCLRWKT